MAPQRVLGRGRRKQRAGQRLRGLDTRLFLDCWGGVDVVLGWARAGADCGGEDLLEALGGGDFFDGFEILLRLVMGRREGEGEKCLDGFDLQFERSVFVDYDHRVRM